MSLGWRLGLTTSVIVTLVMGVLILTNRYREMQRGWGERDHLLQESLVSVATDLEKASSLEAVRQALSAFQEAYANRGYADHEIVLRDLRGRMVASAGPEPRNPGATWTLRASLPVSSSLLPHGRGVLAVRQDATEFAKEMERGWLLSLIDLVSTALTILLCLLVANEYLVTRPLRQLLRGMRQMEMGYWGGLQVPRGAREIRLLAHRFQQLGEKLEETMRRLVDAERRALATPLRDPNAALPLSTKQTGGNASVSPRRPLPLPESPTTDLLRLEERLLLEYLSDKCRLLESGDPASPPMQEAAKEAWERDIIVAERLGAQHLKARLEDASLRILDPDGFDTTQHLLDTLVADRRGWLGEQEAKVREALRMHGVAFLGIQHRVKHVGSVWRKVNGKGLRLEQLHDIFALRIIVAEEPDCYRALDAIHQQFDPRLLRFKDYIASPKPSGYQSLHTCVRSQEGFVFEVQIRTVEMHERAEHGTAAHWRYKREVGTDADPSTGSVPARKRWWSRWRRHLA